MNLLILALFLAPPAGASSGPVPQQVTQQVTETVAVRGHRLDPEEYAAWVVGYTDAVGLAWYRGLTRFDPDGGATDLALVLADAQAELLQACEGAAQVPAFGDDSALPEAAITYAERVAQALDDGLPVLLDLMSQPIPDDAGLAAAQRVWAALLAQQVELRSQLVAAQEDFAARHSGRVAPSLVPWEGLSRWTGPDTLALPGPVSVVLAARRHNALVKRQAALLRLWPQVVTLNSLPPQDAAAIRPRLEAQLATHRSALEEVGPLAGHDGLRLAVLAYTDALQDGLVQGPADRIDRVGAAHRSFNRAMTDYQAWWRFDAYLAWAQGDRASAVERVPARQMP